MSESKITKGDLVDAVYKSTDVEKQIIQKIIDSFLLHTRESLETGATIELRGFGTFEARLRKGRSEARNPKTGEKLSVEPHYVAAFRAGQLLKEKLWNLKKEDEK
ncbi:integration host factor subunit beta [Treponema bryantii]|uniref:Integration host factor subunit beta n=1 Tax=Treponema bryantii TaxID=163 RepID=A0A1I3K9S7_9SPIR|nr:HU family DNA-binding protein [Treponema bryantii]SFI69058.1 integration host factor subunit beta [Treponema bryantii]